MTRPAGPAAARARLWTLAVTLLALSAARADPPKPAPAEAKKDAADAARAEAEKQVRRDAEQVVDGIDLEVQVDDRWEKVERIEKPLLYYGDLTRANDHGSLWAWGRKGRPVALLELFQSTGDRTKWVSTVCNTSGRRLRAIRDGAPWWYENMSATELKDVPGAPAPAAGASQRQLQLKLLARKFTGHQFWDPNNTRYELRRLERPLHTYRDEENGLLEGGLFTLANGTNPEINLFLEARTDPKDRTKSVWQFAVGRTSHAELHLEYNGKEVLTAPRADRLSSRDGPYWLDLIYRKAPLLEPEK